MTPPGTIPAQRDKDQVVHVYIQSEWRGPPQWGHTGTTLFVFAGMDPQVVFDKWCDGMEKTRKHFKRQAYAIFVLNEAHSH